MGYKMSENPLDNGVDIELICDSCEQEVKYFVSYIGILHQTIPRIPQIGPGFGWRLLDGEVLCPDCQKRRMKDEGNERLV